MSFGMVDWPSHSVVESCHLLYFIFLSNHNGQCETPAAVPTAVFAAIRIWELHFSRVHDETKFPIVFKGTLSYFSYILTGLKPFSSRLLSKTVKITISKTVMLPVLYVCF
jgi:hypothetical protein